MQTNLPINRKHDKVINSFINTHTKLSINLVYNLVNFIAIAALYPLIPILMCYGENQHEVSKAVGLSYNVEFIIGGLIAITIVAVVTSILFKDIEEWIILLHQKDVAFEKINEIRKQSINLPYIIYICQTFLLIFATALVSIAVRMILNFPMMLIIKLNIIVFSFSFFTADISYIFTKNIFSKILSDTYLDTFANSVRVDIKAKMFMQIIPIIISTSFLMALIGYSQVVEEKGDILYTSYKLQMQDKLLNLNDIHDSKMILTALTSVKLEGVKTTSFVVLPEGNIITSDNSVNSPSFIYTINNPIDGDRVYGITKEMQGVIQKVKIKDYYVSAGIKFEVISQKTVDFFTIALICLLLLNALIVYYFSKSISNDVSQVADSLLAISEGGDNEIRKKIPVISNDEIGDLVTAFNKLQQYETKSDKVKNDFFANVSHELRTPLNIILASIQLSYDLEKPDNENDYHDYNKNNINRTLDTIKKNSYRLLRLINNLIDSSKITASFYDIHMTNCNIVNIVEDISSSVIDYVKARDLNIIFDTSIEEMIIACDADIIERIILNLLSNSVKFTNPGGSIFIRMYEENENIIISVKDTGIGIKFDEQKMVFERFKQVDKALNRKKEGSGIGLYLAKLLVEMHKGSIELKSELGNGTEFIITLPIIVLDNKEETNLLENQITSHKVINGIDKIEIEFSDIYSL